MRKRLAANIGSMFVWQVAGYLIPLLTFPYLTRILGVRHFGEYSLAFAIATYLAMITDWGFNLSATGAVARLRDDRASLTEVFWNTFAARLLLAGLCLVGLAAATLLIPSLRPIAPIVFAAAGMAVANAFTVGWCLQGLERFGAFTIAATAGKALTVPATFLLVHGPNDTALAALVQSGGNAAGAAVSLILLRRTGLIGPVRTGFAGIVHQLRESWHMFVSVLSANLYTSTNVLVLGAIAGPGALGIYAAADRLRLAAQGLINPISQVLYPHSTRLMAEDRSQGQRFAQRLLVAQSAFTALVSLAMFVLAPWIIMILAGPAFAGAVTILRIMAPLPLLVGISNVLGIQMMLPLGLSKAFSRILMITGVLNLVIVVPLAMLGSANGAAAATLVSEIFVTLAMAVSLWRAGFLSKWN